MRIRSLGREDPLEEGKATHSSILPWRTPWTGRLVGYSPQGHKESDVAEVTQHAGTEGHQVRTCVLSCSVVSDFLQPQGLQPARLLCPWGLSRQEYQRGLPYPPPQDLPNPETEPRSPTLQADSLLFEPPEKPKSVCNFIYSSVITYLDSALISHEKTESKILPSSPENTLKRCSEM